MLFRAIIKFFSQSLYLHKVFYYVAGGIVVLYIFSYFIPVLYDVAGIGLLLLAVSVFVDSFLIFGKRYALRAERITADRWSNGDHNKVLLHFQNNYSFPVDARIIDELPAQFQERNWFRRARFESQAEHQVAYSVKPLSRGEYVYGNVNVFVKGPLQLVSRKFVFPAAKTIKVYPSYIQMRRYHLLAVSNRLQEAGIKRVRKLGHSMEFEQIKEYVRGDDYRTINWKATARKSDLMVNNYTDERSQQIYCLINKGRAMISKSQAKYIQSLAQKKYRDEEGLFIAEGPKLVKDLLQNETARPVQIYAVDDWIQGNEEILSQVDVIKINEAELERISQLTTPKQVVGVFKKFESKPPVTKDQISLVLDGIQDPGNLGTILRIADWFGISDIICSMDCADVYNPKVVQATMGSIARVNVFYTDLLTWIKEQHKSKLYAATLEGKDVTKMTSLGEGLIVIGNESKGIRDELMEFANERITIPKKGKADSLNAAVATGIILSNLA